MGLDTKFPPCSWETGVDTETDGKPSAVAFGDEPRLSAADGVKFLSTPIALGSSTTSGLIRVTSSGTGRLDAWIDFNQDGDWEIPEKKLSTVKV